jgi:quercetin dioxygenase-like cupin family protein
VAIDEAQVWRVYSLDDGTTSMEQVTIPLAEDRAGRTSKLLDGPGVMIRRSAPGRAASWHTAPRRQMIATVSGWGEIETGDGQRLRLRPGVLVVVEDVTGVGHKTWTDPVEGWHMLFIPLDDATTLP